MRKFGASGIQQVGCATTHLLPQYAPTSTLSANNKYQPDSVRSIGAAPIIGSARIFNLASLCLLSFDPSKSKPLGRPKPERTAESRDKQVQPCWRLPLSLRRYLKRNFKTHSFCLPLSLALAFSTPPPPAVWRPQAKRPCFGPTKPQR